MNLKNIIKLSKPYKMDRNVELGYLSERKIKDLRLQIGKNARLRSGTVIYVGSRIGNNFETGHNVIIREQNVIGDDVCIWSNSVIDYSCRIGNRVKIHCGVYVAQFTLIEDNVFLAPGVMIASDPLPICNKCLKGPTIKKGVRVGLNAILLPGVTLGEYSFVGAGSVVTKDVPPRTVVYGVPARVVKKIEELRCPNKRINCSGEIENWERR